MTKKDKREQKVNTFLRTKVEEIDQEEKKQVVVQEMLNPQKRLQELIDNTRITRNNYYYKSQTERDPANKRAYTIKFEEWH